MERKGHPRMTINNAQDFSDVCGDMIDEFVETFRNIKGLTREPDEDDFDMFDGIEIQWMYTQRAMRLIDTYIKRCCKVGEKYWDDFELDIKCSNIIMP